LDKYVKPEIDHILKENPNLPAVKVVKEAESNKIVCKIERFPGDRFLIKRWPSSINRTEQLSIEIFKTYKNGEDRLRAEQERMKNFEDKMEAGYKYIDIYNIHDLETYLKGNKKVVIERIENIIRLLTDFLNYEILLTDKNVSYDFEICADKKILLLAGNTLSDFDKLEESNVDSILFTIPSVIEEFKKEFDKTMNNIGKKGCKNKVETLKSFENQLKIKKKLTL
jgi:hypothetical protein